MRDCKILFYTTSCQDQNKYIFMQPQILEIIVEDDEEYQWKNTSQEIQEGIGKDNILGFFMFVGCLICPRDGHSYASRNL